jgi:hypothetical protein
MEQQRLAFQPPRRDPIGFEARLIFLSARASPVHAQAHRRVYVARGENRFPMLRIGLFEQFDPPARVLVACLGIGANPCFQRAALAQETAQQRVHVALCAPALQECCGAHCLIDHGVFGVAARLERIERAP